MKKIFLLILILSLFFYGCGVDYVTTEKLIKAEFKAKKYFGDIWVLTFESGLILQQNSWHKKINYKLNATYDIYRMKRNGRIILREMKQKGKRCVNGGQVKRLN